MLTRAAEMRLSMPTHNSIKGASMSNHTQIRWLAGATVLCATSMLAGCVTPQEEAFVSRCTGTAVDVVLRIVLDASDKPTHVVDAGSGANADVIHVCPGAKVTWTLEPKGFDIEFARKTPFGWMKKPSKPSTGKHELSDRIKDKDDIHCDGYKYAVNVGGKVLDPIIIVDR